MRIRLVAAIFVVSAGALLGASQQPPPQQPPSRQTPPPPSAPIARETSQPQAPAEVVRTLSTGGAKEVELAQLAATKATSADVKAFANRMVADHGKVNKELASLASKKGWQVATSPDIKTESDKLSPLSGAAFDRAYMDMMVANHQKTLDLLQAQAKSATDEDLKAFVSKITPAVQEHLKLARDIRAKLS